MRQRGFFRALAWLACAGALVLAPPVGAAQTDHPGRITVTATSFRSDDGRLRCFLYDVADAFPTHPERAFAAAFGPISARSATCTFDDIPPGRYAIALHHDQNADGRVDTGLFGIPTEGLGASNDAAGSFGPPSFEAAAFAFAGGELPLRAHLGYVF